MEGKVREATNNDAWGASSTLLQEIARATGNYQHFNEIMPMIYKRFAENRQQWRQIYKTLQLLEYLIKHGSERVIDNLKDHLYEIKQFQSYQFVDEKGKDQGVNVRFRAKEICELVSDDVRLKEERNRAQVNKNKYQGVASEEVRNGMAFGGHSAVTSPAANEQRRSSGDYDPSKHGRTGNTPRGSVHDVSVQSKPAQEALFDIGKATTAVANTTVQWNSNNSTVASNSNNNAAAVFGASDGFADFQSAPVIYNSQPAAVDLFGGFAGAAPVQQQQQQQPFAAFPSQPAQPQQAGFGGDRKQSGFADFGAFSSAPFGQAQAPVAAMNNNSNMFMPFSTGVATIPAINQGNIQPVPAQSQQQTGPKSMNDFLSSNLASLDSLGKFGGNQQRQNGPSLYQVAATQSVAQPSQMPPFQSSPSQPFIQSTPAAFSAAQLPMQPLQPQPFQQPKQAAANNGWQGSGGFGGSLI